MKLYTVDFSPVWPVPSGLVIWAKDSNEAYEIAKKTITHTDDFDIIPWLGMDKSGVVFYESGDY